MDVESKIENLFEDHSIINILKNVKAPTPITEDNLTSLTISRRSGIQSINTSMISMRLLMVLAFTWQSLADLTLLSLSEKLAAGCYLLSHLWRIRDYKLHYCRPGCNVRSHFTNITEHGSPIAYCAGSDRQPADPAVGFADANFTRVSDELRKPISGYCFFLYFFSGLLAL